MRYVALFILLILAGTISAGENEYQVEIDSFFDLLQKGKIEESVSSLYRTNPYVSSIPDQIVNVKNQLVGLSGLVGNMNSLQKIDVFNVKGGFVHVTYLASYDRQPVRFEFQFFKVDNGWRIYSFSFDDDIASEIQSLARKQALQSD